MKTIKVEKFSEVPDNFTGRAEDRHGIKWWYKNGKIHRDDGPAYKSIFSGLELWYKNGVYHRTDGPAFIHSDGDVEYFINGKLVTKEAQELFNWLFKSETE